MNEREKFYEYLQECGFNKATAWNEILAFLLWKLGQNVSEPLVTLSNEYFEYFNR